MATAGHSAVIKAAGTHNADASTGYTAVEAKSVSFNRSVDLLDTTALTDSQLRERIQGLKDLEVSITCDFIVVGSSTGQGHLRDSLDNDVPVYIVFLPDGTNGYHAGMRCESYDIGTDVDGLATVTYNLSLDAGSSQTTIADVASP